MECSFLCPDIGVFKGSQELQGTRRRGVIRRRGEYREGRRGSRLSRVLQVRNVHVSFH